MSSEAIARPDARTCGEDHLGGGGGNDWTRIRRSEPDEALARRHPAKGGSARDGSR